MAREPVQGRKFSFKDMITSGSSGQASATGTIGVFTCILSLAMILAAAIYYFVAPDQAENVIMLVDRATVILGIGATLLGCRKISGAVASTRAAGIIKGIEDAVSQGSQQQPQDGGATPKEG